MLLLTPTTVPPPFSVSQTCAGDAGQALDDGAVHPAVHDAPRLQQLVVDVQPRPPAVGGQLEVGQAELGVESVAEPGWHFRRHALCLHVAVRRLCAGARRYCRGMAKSAKDLVEAANAVVPRISPAEAQEKIAAGNVLVVDVRDAPEVEKTGKVAGAVHVPRGMLEFRADPESPYHDANFAKDKTVIVYCASGGRSALVRAGPQGTGLRRGLQPRCLR